MRSKVDSRSHCIYAFNFLTDNPIMALHPEEENFIKTTVVITKIFPKHLRRKFITLWDQKYSSIPWNNDAASGAHLLSKIKVKGKRRKMRRRKRKKKGNKERKGKQGKREKQGKLLQDVKKNLKSGNVESWDSTALFFVFLYSGLTLIAPCRPRNKRTAPLYKSEDIDRFIEIRSQFFSHVIDSRVSASVFIKLMRELKNLAKSLFGNVAEAEIDKIENATQIVEQQSVPALQQQLKKEQKLNDEFEKWKDEWEKELNGDH